MSERLYLNGQTVVDRVLAAVVKPGDVVVDCTAGNGHDTLTLARLVGPRGRVVALDIQPEALQKTRERLKEQRYGGTVDLHLMDHQNLEELDLAGARAFVFNLGYLPGGDKNTTTCADTTLRALEICLDLVVSGGVVTLMIYPGHGEGAREHWALSAFVKQLDQNQFDVVRIDFPNRKNDSPYPLIIQKL